MASMLGAGAAHSVMAKNPQNTLESVKRLGRMKKVLRRFIRFTRWAFYQSLVVDTHQRQSLRRRGDACVATVVAVENSLHVGRRAFAEAGFAQRADEEAHHVLEEGVGLDLDGDGEGVAARRLAGERGGARAP